MIFQIFFLKQTQELHIKDEIIEIISCSDSNQDDTGLNFGTVTDDSKEPETLDGNCQDEVSLLIPKYESSGLDSQGAGPLISQPMFSDGLGGAMSGSSDMQAVSKAFTDTTVNDNSITGIFQL